MHTAKLQAQTFPRASESEGVCVCVSRGMSYTCVRHPGRPGCCLRRPLPPAPHVPPRRPARLHGLALVVDVLVLVDLALHVRVCV